MYWTPVTRGYDSYETARGGLQPPLITQTVIVLKVSQGVALASGTSPTFLSGTDTDSTPSLNLWKLDPEQQGFVLESVPKIQDMGNHTVCVIPRRPSSKPVSP